MVLVRRPPDRAPVLLACVREEVARCAKDLGVQTRSLVIGGVVSAPSSCKTREVTHRTLTAIVNPNIVY